MAVSDPPSRNLRAPAAAHAAVNEHAHGPVTTGSLPAFLTSDAALDHVEHDAAGKVLMPP